MEKITLSRLAKAVGSVCESEQEIDTICIDTRKIVDGCLFFAIKGENFDGHDFIDQAYTSGAAGVVTSRPAEGREGVILVPDTRKALLDMAAFYRSFFNIFMVGVTGSVGKTSTKEMIHTVLSAKGKTLKTEGNFNNEIGMPMTMFSLDSSFQNAVVEMGMSDFGEIRALTNVCHPNAAVITNIGVSHLENLGSRENILKAKMEITEGMAEDAPLILNADDDLLKNVSCHTDHPVIYYGLNEGDVTATELKTVNGSTQFLIHFYGKSIQAEIPVIGKHNVYNALSGFCVGMLADMEPEQIVKAMRLYKNAGLRQNISVINQLTVIADCYNASPHSMYAAIDVITNVACDGKRICVFGDMLELGEVSDEAHIEVGKAVARSRVDHLVCFGELSKGMKRGAMMVGMKNIPCFTDHKEAADYLLKLIKPGDAVIYKASRGMHLEEVMNLVNKEWQNG